MNIPEYVHERLKTATQNGDHLGNCKVRVKDLALLLLLLEKEELVQTAEEKAKKPK